MVAPLWKIDEIRQHVAVVDGKVAPTLVLMNARYLHSIFKTWLTANIWIYHDRIIYVGDKMPTNSEQVELVDCAGKTVVPGYIEP
ncbi:MAG TPA: adenosine deaminase, partial [Metalysinibacillus sp.]